MRNYDHNSIAIADSYAQTLLTLTESAGTSGAVLEQFESFVTLMDHDAAFGDFMVNPMVDDDKRQLVLEKHFRGRIPDLLLNVLQVANRKGRSALVPLICDRFRAALKVARNEVDVYVTSAVELTPPLRESIQATASQVAGKQARLVEAVDPTILGGLIVRIGDRKLDSSVARQLTRLRQQLNGRATQEIHGGKKFYDSVDVA